MKRHNPYLFFSLGKALEQLRNLPKEGGKVSALFFRLFDARGSLNTLLEADGVLPPTSARAIKGLQDAIDALAMEEQDGKFAIYDKTISPEQVRSIKKRISELEIVLAIDILDSALYVVVPKSIYSTESLVRSADVAIKSTLSEQEQNSIPIETYKDFNEAGRCLAFEVPTDAGFHVARAVEATVRRYWLVILKKTTRPPQMATCISDLRKIGENPKVLDVLDHFRELHRNTLMHPEAFLNNREALRLFDIAKSAISAVGERLSMVENP